MAALFVQGPFSLFPAHPLATTDTERQPCRPRQIALFASSNVGQYES